MKTLFGVLIALVLVLVVSAYAADTIGTFGAPNSSGVYPMKVEDDRKITVASDATFVSAGTTTISGTLTIDGSIYSPITTFDGGVILPTATIDPCPTLGPGAVFINGTTGAPCFCNKVSVDLSLYNGTSACF